MKGWPTTIVWLVLSGCAPKPAAPPQIVVLPGPSWTETPSPVAGALSAVGYVALLPKVEQEAELARFAAAFERDRLPSDRLRLAMLLMLGDASLQDTARARGLLEEAPFAADQGAYEALARLVLALVAEREGRAVEAKATDAMAQELAAERVRRREAEERAAAFDELQRRLDALKVLETEGAR